MKQPIVMKQTRFNLKPRDGNPAHFKPGSVFILVLTLLFVNQACGSGNRDRNSPERKNAGHPDSGIEVDTSLYWKYDGERVLLLGAFNHGHNPFIDGSTTDTVNVEEMGTIVNQIQQMAEIGGNTLRCVLDPGRGAHVGFESYERTAGGLYDLTKPGGAYWDRLETFVVEAENLGVIVEIEIWDRFDWFGVNWEYCPFNPVNNMNYTMEGSGMNSKYERGEIYTRHPMSKTVPGHQAYDTASDSRKRQYDLVRAYQEIFVTQVLEVTSPFRNVLYNMNNETSEPPAWGEYWIDHLRQEAEARNISVVCTNMQDGVQEVPHSDVFLHQLDRRDQYDYLDASQVNSRHRDTTHWYKVKWITDRAREKGWLIHMTKIYGNDERKPAPWASWKPGDSDNAVEEWWRNLIAGVAGVRFHRPYSGIGLGVQSIACIRATRKVESLVKFWDVRPHMELLSDLDYDEAYLAADPGRQYILYFTHQGSGSVGLNLQGSSGKTFSLRWVNINTGEWGKERTLEGGTIQTIERPDTTTHWVAVLK